MANDDGHNFTTAFILGGIFGFVAGILAAPRSGEEIRHELGDRSRTLRDQVERLAERVRQQFPTHDDDTDGGTREA